MDIKLRKNFKIKNTYTFYRLISNITKRKFFLKRKSFKKLLGTVTIEFLNIFKFLSYLLFLKKNRYLFFNLIYMRFFAAIQTDLRKFKYNNKPSVKVTIKVKKLKLFKFIFMYNIITFKAFIDAFRFFKVFKTKNERIYYYLLLKFFKNKIFINLLDSFKKNYLMLTPGFFIKFFEKKKSIKKNKLIKFLMIKYLRKLLIIANIKNLIVFVKKTPVLLPEIINIINQPIVHKFADPFKKTIINETKKPYFFKIWYYIFTESKIFGLNKSKKVGRIKRKVLRKIVKENHIID